MSHANLHSKHPVRTQTFFDAPDLYPEYAFLVTRHRGLHITKRFFHIHRTVLLAISPAIALGISAFRTDLLPNSWHDGISLAELQALFSIALSTDLMIAHFLGFCSALACMVAIAMLALSAHPLLYFAAWAKKPTWAAAAVPSALGWAIGLWGSRKFIWGLASGLWVGLACTCFTLKVVSFVSACGSVKAKPMTTMPSLHLSLGEYAFFLFLVPALHCEPRFLTNATRLPKRPRKAAQEFIHACMTYLSVHIIGNGLLAPTLRILTACFQPSWVDGDSNVALTMNGQGGWWPTWQEGMEAEGGLSALECTAWVVWLMATVSPLVHFLCFYAFWHCLCLGMAESGGYPDRYLYGPWWLQNEDIQDYYRLWSMPVHRWLSRYVYLPIIEAVSRSTALDGRNVDTKDSDGNGCRKSAIISTTPKGTTVPLMHSTAWLKTGKPSVLLLNVASFATFVVSSVFHEATTFVGMQQTCWPFSSVMLIFGNILMQMWDKIFPLRQTGTGTESKDSGSGSKDKNFDQASMKMRLREVGRGRAAMVTFCVLEKQGLLVFQYLAWHWWGAVMRNCNVHN